MGVAANAYKSCVWEVEGQGSEIQSSPGLCETLAPKQTNKEANKRNQKSESQNYSVPLVQNQTRKTFEGSSNVIQEAWLRPGPVLSKQWAADKTMFLPLWSEDHHHLRDWMGWRTYWWNWNSTSWEAPSEEREETSVGTGYQSSPLSLTPCLSVDAFFPFPGPQFLWQPLRKDGDLCHPSPDMFVWTRFVLYLSRPEKYKALRIGIF